MRREVMGLVAVTAMLLSMLGVANAAVLADDGPPVVMAPRAEEPPTGGTPWWERCRRIYRQGEMTRRIWHACNDHAPHDRPTDRPVDRCRLLLHEGDLTRRIWLACHDRPHDRAHDHQRRFDRLIDRPIDRPVDRPVDTPVDRPIDRPLDRPIDRPIERPTHRSDEPGQGAEPDGSIDSAR